VRVEDFAVLGDMTITSVTLNLLSLGGKAGLLPLLSEKRSAIIGVFFEEDFLTHYGGPFLIQ
jgi:hypothetical protein